MNDNNGIKLIKEFIKNMYYTYGKESNKKDDWTNILFIKYKIDNGSNADAIADTFDNAMSALAPPPK